ncbi:hypothetical protein [Anoxynatronum sibiricum]|uniref:Tetratricopeptide repeat protein n=1 Tax=Anoxynatronum sibiricum TaxID=210623 RepID=A0ABU9VQX6_9CLOT
MALIKEYVPFIDFLMASIYNECIKGHVEGSIIVSKSSKKMSSANTSLTLKRNNRNKGLEVISNSLISQFVTSDVPHELRSPLYPIQASLGVLGILLIFFSFRIPLAFFAGALLLIIRRQWRKKTDAPSVAYREAIQALRRKQHAACIEALNRVMEYPKAPPFLLMVIASCHLEQENPAAAYNAYHRYFTSTSSSEWNNPVYWSSMENYLLLSLEKNQANTAMSVAQYLPESEEARQDARAWKSYYLGRLSYKLQRLDEAKLHFESVLNQQSLKALPALDAAYQLSLLNWQQGVIETAQQQLLAIQRQSPGYKNVSLLLEILKKPDPVFDPAYMD